jgi:CubicO group peptidase (beta-lactamase class C family)
MKAYRCIGLVLAIVLMASTLIACGTEKKVFDDDLASQLQEMLEAAVKSRATKYPGAVLHVSSPELGTWTGAAGLGEIATNTAMRPNDKFRAGSLTKPFISVITLKLVEEELFALEDTLSELLPESVTGKFPNIDQITLRMLLNHTSGLPDFMELAGPEILAIVLGGAGVGPNPDKVWKEEEFLDFAAAQKPYRFGTPFALMVHPNTAV